MWVTKNVHVGVCIGMKTKQEWPLIQSLSKTLTVKDSLIMYCLRLLIIIIIIISEKAKGSVLFQNVIELDKLDFGF